MQRRRHRRARILRPLTKANLTLLSASARMNVTRAEAQARARLLDVEGYDVVLDLTIGDVTFGSTTTARFRCTEPGA